MTEFLLTPDRLAGDERGPLYLRLQAMIRSAVASGTLAPNATLPAEREFAASLGISRVTVRKAIQGLVAEGLLRQRRGSGTFVAGATRRFELPLSGLSSFTEDMRSRGLTATAIWMMRSVGMPTSAEAMMLGLPPTERVTRLHRLRLADSEPMAVERSLLPARFLPDPARFEGSLYDTLTAAGLRPVRAVQRLNAENADEGDARLLGIPPGGAILAIERIAYLADGRVVEFTRSHYRGDAYDFVAELRPDPKEGN
ncbi:GntR family transcriptional regulator [Kaistia algarum]|uniref:GntR family transcriptional regulator n=1 Tax=Kaistia algarum TaxID=2083279 RepID=UPI000CE9150D|nr:GntR family transcriptional regulator [Kaistia algarum]MCX5515897.1 GntR family transcriptional regulator [Kaistia algarum]PPE80740.1 GntR family transcriptional regulator [Kaistia algarum]